MAEKVDLSKDLREISLLQCTMVKKGIIEMTDEEVEIFNHHNWKLFLHMLGVKLIEKYRELVEGECGLIFSLQKKKSF